MNMALIDKIREYERQGNLEHIFNFFAPLLENGEVHPLLTKSELLSITSRDSKVREIIDFIISFSNIDPNYPKYGLVDFIKIYEYYTGTDGKRRLPLPKYVPTPIFPYLKEMQENYLKYLEESYPKDLPRRPGLIVMSGYRSPYYQVIVFVRNLHQVGIERTLEVTSLPGESQHASFKNCAIDFTSMGDENGSMCDFEKTIEFEWLLSNSFKYNFWLPYFPSSSDPKAPLGQNGLAVEPWHYEYRPDAADLTQKNNVIDLFNRRLSL